jgi:hypothetical protein
MDNNFLETAENLCETFRQGDTYNTRGTLTLLSLSRRHSIPCVTEFNDFVRELAGAEARQKQRPGPPFQRAISPSCTDSPSLHVSEMASTGDCVRLSATLKHPRCFHNY